MGEYGELYAEGRARFIDVVSGADADVRVPTCPLWTVKDTVAHVAGICADIIEGRLDGVATEPWTAAQVAERRDRTLAEVIEEWRTTGPQIDALVDAFGPTGAQLLTDLTTHEHDVRLALGRRGARDAAVIDIANDFTVTNMLGRTVPATGAGALRVRAGDREWQVGGDGAAVATLSADQFELLRAVTGRRSRAQIAALDWSTDPSPFLAAFEGGPFTFPSADVIE